MKIAVCCCTYLRPKLLGQMIYCFEQQDYPDREMVILDDAGQYEPRVGPNWRLVVETKRYGSLGEKRNVVTGMVSDDVEALAIWDDDDLYLPWALTATVAALRQAEWSRPSVVLHPQKGGSLKQHWTEGWYNAQWGFRRSAYNRIGGYPPLSGNEDRYMAARMEAEGTEVTQADPIGLGFRPFFVCTMRSSGDRRTRRLSTFHGGGWDMMGRFLPAEKSGLEVKPSRWLDLSKPNIESGIYPREW